MEEVIARMGKPEDMETEGESSSADAGSTNAGGGYGAGAWSSNTAYSTTRRRLYRNPMTRCWVVSLVEWLPIWVGM